MSIQRSVSRLLTLGLMALGASASAGTCAPRSYRCGHCQLVVPLPLEAHLLVLVFGQVQVPLSRQLWFPSLLMAVLLLLLRQ